MTYRDGKRWITRRAWVLWAALSVILAIAAPAGAAFDTSGTLSEESPITEADLPPGTVELVSDASIELANSPLLAEARAGWESDDAFVLQIDYQLEFRSKVDFMSSHPAYLGQLLAERPMNMGAQSMGLFMTDSEVAEMERRDALGDKMSDLVASVTGIDESQLEEGTAPDYGPNFGGIWQDQLDGGKIALAVVNPSAIDVKPLHAIVGGAEHLKIIDADFSYHEIETYKAQLWDNLTDVGVDGDVGVVWGDRGFLIEVRVPNPETLDPAVGFGVESAAYDVVYGASEKQVSFPYAYHSLADQQPGLRIEVRDGSDYSYCTWAFNGHTSTYNYIITAGHCLEDHANYSGGQLSGVDVWQGGSSARDLTSSPYVRSLDNATYDVARISSGYADDNCYHGNQYTSSPAPHCAWPMTNRASHNSWELGSDRTCASLSSSNLYKCGYVIEENAGTGSNRMVADFSVIGGDSGSGAKWDYRIDGVITDAGDGTAFIQTAWHATVQLGNGYFYFNCAVGKKTYSDPSSWGTCPVVDA